MNWLEFHKTDDFDLPPAQYRTDQSNFSWRASTVPPDIIRFTARLSGQMGRNLSHYAAEHSSSFTELMHVPIQTANLLADALGRLIEAECTFSHMIEAIEKPFAEFAATCLKVRESLEGKNTPIVQKESITVNEMPTVHGELYVLCDTFEIDTTRIWTEASQPFPYNLELVFTGRLSDCLIHLNHSKPDRLQMVCQLARLAMGGLMESLAILVLQHELGPVYGFGENEYVNMIGNAAFRLYSAVPTIHHSAATP